MRVLKSPSLSGTAFLWSMLFLAVFLSFVAVPVGWRGGVWAVCIGALYYAVIGTLDAVTDRIVFLRRRLNDIETYTVEARKMEILSHLTDKQIEFFKANALIIRVIMGNDGLVKYLQWMDNLISFNFIYQFLERSDDDFLPPVRQWPEGSNERDWAQAFTALLVNYGWAEPAAGNRPARWTRDGYEEVMRVLEL